jgi:hypothetical protein
MFYGPTQIVLTVNDYLSVRLEEDSLRIERTVPLKTSLKPKRFFAMSVAETVIAWALRRTGTSMRPGEGLIHLTKRFCSVQSFELVFEPVISDLRFEYLVAISEGRPWKARRHYVCGCGTFWMTVVMFGFSSAAKMLRRRVTKA